MSRKPLEEYERLEIKKRAQQVNFEISQLGIVDIFDMIEQKALLIKSPYVNSKEQARFSGFCTYIDKNFVVFINTAYSLGHQRFTAAHELYHLYYDADKLKSNKLLKKDKTEDHNEKLAQCFASELLMPEDRLRSLFAKEVGEKELTVHHVIRLHQTFKVSYRAMLTRCCNLGLITLNTRDELLKFGSIENAELLQKLTKENGYKTDILLPSYEKYVSREFVDLAIDNFGNNKISEGRLKSLLAYAGIDDYESIIKGKKE